MNAYFLIKEENQYELKIRGQPITGSAEDLRKRLTKCVRLNTPIDPAVLASLSVEDELKACEDKYELLAASAAEYEGNYTDTEGQRLLARLWHNYLRAERIPVGATVDEVVSQRYTELLKKAKGLLDRADDKKSSTSEPSTSVALQIDPLSTVGTVQVGNQTTPTYTTAALGPQPIVSVTAPPRMPPLCTSLTSEADNSAMPTYTTPAFALQPSMSTAAPPQVSPWRTKGVPVYKWGLQFDGRSQSVGAFLQRVEELRRARGVTTGELFDSAVDLFTGPALTWYRSTIGRLGNWEQLCRDMELVFQHPDHDIHLQQEIFNRVQADTEPIDLFIAAMEGLYGRLSTRVSEEVKLKQILHNLHPQLQDRLALVDVQSIEQLRVMGRKAEAGRLRSLTARGISANAEVLEPDLAYTPPRRRLNQGNSRTVPERKVFQATEAYDVTCFNCHSKGHLSRECRSNRGNATSRLICWRCNRAGHIQKDCRARLHPSSPRSGNEAGVSGIADAKPRN